LPVVRRTERPETRRAIAANRPGNTSPQLRAMPPVAAAPIRVSRRPAPIAAVQGERQGAGGQQGSSRERQAHHHRSSRPEPRDGDRSGIYA
jgi:hypothetical protein